MPTFEWMIANDYQILPIVFNDALNIYGYGDYREIPMVRARLFPVYVYRHT